MKPIRCSPVRQDHRRHSRAIPKIDGFGSTGEVRDECDTSDVFRCKKDAPGSGYALETNDVDGVQQLDDRGDLEVSEAAERVHKFSVVVPVKNDQI